MRVEGLGFRAVTMGYIARLLLFRSLRFGVQGWGLAISGFGIRVLNEGLYSVSLALLSCKGLLRFSGRRRTAGPEGVGFRV